MWQQEAIPLSLISLALSDGLVGADDAQSVALTTIRGYGGMPTPPPQLSPTQHLIRALNPWPM